MSKALTLVSPTAAGGIMRQQAGHCIEDWKNAASESVQPYGYRPMSQTSVCLAPQTQRDRLH